MAPYELRLTSQIGAAGLLFGAVTGTLRSAHPVLWATATSIQWFLLGGTYWGVRSALLQTRVEDPLEVDPTTKEYISAAAGGISAAVVGGITRGRANILPGTFMGSLTGYLGQKAYHFLDARQSSSLPQSYRPSSRSQHSSSTMSTSETPQPLPMWQRALQSKYSPVKHLTHQEYKKVLQDKLLRVEAEIAVLDDDIAALKKAQGESAIVESTAPPNNAR